MIERKPRIHSVNIILGVIVGVALSLLVNISTGGTSPSLLGWIVLILVTSIAILITRQQEKSQQAFESYTTAILQEMVLHSSLIVTILNYRDKSNPQNASLVVQKRMKKVLDTLDNEQKKDLIEFLGQNDLVKVVIGPQLQRIDLQKVNLSEANLSEVNLSEANLSKAILVNADLTEAILQKANLTRANLSGANLSRANLGGEKRTVTLTHYSPDIVTQVHSAYEKVSWNVANLTETNLCGATLDHANLTRTILQKANLTRANLSGANLSEADLNGAILDYADLRGTIVTSQQLETAYSVKNVIRT